MFKFFELIFYLLHVIGHVILPVKKYMTGGFRNVYWGDIALYKGVC